MQVATFRNARQIRIYLDFDGVICTHDSYRRAIAAGFDVERGFTPATGWMPLDSDCVGRVLELVRWADGQGWEVTVVFSTSWREVFEADQLVAFLERVGGDRWPCTFQALAPTLRDPGEVEFFGRCRTIREDRFRADVPLDQLVILEDLEPMYAAEESRTVRTFLPDGFDAEALEKAKALLVPQRTAAPQPPATAPRTAPGGRRPTPKQSAANPR